MYGQRHGLLVGLARRDLGRGLSTLASPCTRQPQPRSQRADPLGAGHTRSCVRWHDGALSACSADRQLGAVSRGVSYACLASRSLSLWFERAWRCAHVRCWWGIPMDGGRRRSLSACVLYNAVPGVWSFEAAPYEICGLVRPPWSWDGAVMGV